MKIKDNSNTKNPNPDGRPFIDVPLFYHILRPLASILAPVWYFLTKLRWILTRPLNIHILPKQTPLLPSIPVVKRLYHVTLGEVLFTAPLILVFLLSYNSSFTNPDTEESGSIASIPLYITFLTANKSNSIISFVLGVPFERMVTWHGLWAILSVVTGGFHYYVAYVYGDEDDRRLQEYYYEDYHGYDKDGEERMLSEDPDGGSGDSIYSLVGPTPNFLKFSFDGGTNTTGTVCILAMAIMVLPSLIPKLRRVLFEVFYYTHVICSFVVLVFGILHGAGGLIFVLIWYILDLVTRYLLQAGFLYPHAASIKSLPSNVIELRFPKPQGFDYNPGQYVMLAIPKLSISQFHPFSISSSPHQDMVTIHIRVLGNWTRRLYDLAQKEDTVQLLMEGPYGRLGVDLDDGERYKMVLLISGGIGITPMQSLCNTLLHEKETKNRPLKKVHFVWSVRQFDMIDAMKDAPLSFQPDLVSHHPTSTSDTEKASADENTNTSNTVEDAANILKTEFYLTGKHVSGNIRDLPLHIRLGRPDIAQIFADMKDTALTHGESHVAVCVCGPTPLVDACRDASRMFSDSPLCGKGVQFDFHDETFEL